LTEQSNIKVNCYGILPAEVRYNHALTDKAKILYAEITSATNSYGMCEEGNEVFAKLLGTDVRTITRGVSQLVEHGYIERLLYNKKRVLKVRNGVQPRATSTVGDVALPPDDVHVEYYEKLLSHWEEKLKCKLYKHTEYYQQLQARLMTFTEEELWKAMENRVAFVTNSDWHQEKENRVHTTRIELLIRDNQTVLRWLNAKDKEYAEEKPKAQPFKYT